MIANDTPDSGMSQRLPTMGPSDSLSRFSDESSEGAGLRPENSLSSLSYTSDIFATALDLELQRAKSRSRRKQSGGNDETCTGENPQDDYGRSLKVQNAWL